MSTPEFRTSLHGIPYNDTVAASPPIKVATAFSRPAQKVSHPGLDSSTYNSQVTQAPSSEANGHPRSPLEQSTTPQKQSASRSRATSTSAQGSQKSLNNNNDTSQTLTSPPSVPQIRVQGNSEQTTPNVEEDGKQWLSVKPTRPRTNSQKRQISDNLQSFQGIALDIPTGSWGDDLQVKNMQFSARGSMFLDGRKVSPTGSIPASTLQRPTLRTQRIPTSSSVPDRMPPRIMSTDEELLSEKVRHYYAHGSDVQDVENQNEIANRMGSTWQNQLRAETDSIVTTSRAPSTKDMSLHPSPSITPLTKDNIPREELELAGGLEDWQDVDNADVDRYGFIMPKSPSLRDISGIKRSPTVSGQGLQRVSTSLQLAAETPRRKRTIRRSSGDIQKRSVSDNLTRTASHSSIPRPSSSKSATVHRHGTLRAASNRLPGNKDRRLMDEAGDMFTLPSALTPGLISRTTTVESDRSVKSKANLETKASSTAARKKETEREEKWRKMARPMASNAKDTDHKGIGGGMLFSFPPVTDAKLISRTWKGIPDTWRAPAWHYFLSVSARKNPQSLADDRLVHLFHEYQDINSPDDVQIDIDVPRTISSHIMFRRRYRGGQRLLFRVLHAMSLHWPETGYVQGMAALAATLLSYYEEEKAFVMLVRLWECRGLAKLYKEGFGGLMEALNDFEHAWLGEGEVAKKLVSLHPHPNTSLSSSSAWTGCHGVRAVSANGVHNNLDIIHPNTLLASGRRLATAQNTLLTNMIAQNDLNVVPTAYGTKWYLTLFNYSIPFPAQLRVWDVFMLLGDNRQTLSSSKSRPQTSSKSSQPPPPQSVNPEDAPFGTTLDVLHATSAALIDGMRDILLDSDFENAMKVLTSWIPIRDEDLFMRVARAEWKLHGERAKKKN